MKIGRGNRSSRRKNLFQCHFVHHKSHMTTRARTRAAEVGSRRLTAWAMARPTSHVYSHISFQSYVTEWSVQADV
jgi:hypothetical protein